MRKGRHYNSLIYLKLNDKYLGGSVIFCVYILVFPACLTGQSINDTTFQQIIKYTIGLVPTKIYHGKIDTFNVNCIYLKDRKESLRIIFNAKANSLTFDTLRIIDIAQVNKILHGEFEGILLVVKSNQIHANAPIEKIVVLHDDSIFQKTILNNKSDSIKNLLNESFRTHGSIQASLITNPESYNGYLNSKMVSWNTQILLESNFLGMPLVFRTGISNQKDPLTYNLKDIQVSLNLTKFERQKVNLNSISFNRLLSIKDKINLEKTKYEEIDKLIYDNENRINDVAQKEIFERKKRVLDTIKKMDTSNLLPEQKILKLNTENSLNERDSIMKWLEKSKREKQKYLEVINKLEFEKKRVELQIVNANNSLKGVLGGVSKVKLDQLNIGKVVPYYSDLSLSSLIISGIDTKIATSEIYLNLSGGTQFEINRINDSKIFATKIGRKTVTYDRFLTSVLIDNKIHSNADKSAIFGFGLEESINKNLFLKYELMYCESDSSQTPEVRSKSTYFQRISLQKMASKLILQYVAENGSSLTFLSTFTGLFFYNPAINLTRTDMLKTQGKICLNFFESKLKLNFNLGVDRDNLSGLKLTRTQNKFWQINPIIRVSKRSKIIINIHQNFLNTSIEKPDISEVYRFNTSISSLTWVYNKINKKKNLNHFYNVSITEFKNKNNNLMNSMWYGQSMYSLSINNRGIVIQNSTSLQKGSDSLMCYSNSYAIFKSIKHFQIGLEFKEISSEIKFFNRCFNVQFSGNVNRLSFSLKLETFQTKRESPIYAMNNLRSTASIQYSF